MADALRRGHPNVARPESRSRSAAGSTPPAPPSSGSPRTTRRRSTRSSRRSRRASHGASKWCRSTRHGSTRHVARQQRCRGAQGAARRCWRGTRPTTRMSAGWARYVLERRFGQAVTAVRVSSLGRRRSHALRRHRAARRATTDRDLGDGHARALKDWMRAGGTLITIADASRWATGENVGLLDDAHRAARRQARGATTRTADNPATRTRRRRNGRAVRLRQGDPAGARAAREHAGRDASRHARHRALAGVRQRRRDRR